ncbi:MAG: hypothetical protein Unbinned2301contig1004_65 [Prokaryotic dsDNA virus sp.]|nr:MAG: hypothetical protein Unbinned2301contig1004_65 [Prokaryotic dsDNA virus sp.]|tara:strand:- start:12681 stop:12902 length:222 start_codon:yes stop_codon:yes gene_type:complete
MEAASIESLETRMFWMLGQSLRNCERADDAEGAQQALNEIDDLRAMTTQSALARRCEAILAQHHPLCAQARPE